MAQGNRLQELLKEREKIREIREPIQELVPMSQYDQILDFKGFRELATDEKLQNYLIQKSKEVIHTQVNDAIHLGKIFEEVANELGKKGSAEGVYTDFVNYCGFNTRTVLRLRKRYSLFLESPEHCKMIVSLLSVREIETLEKKKELLKEFYPGMTLQEAKQLLQEKKLIPEAEKKEEEAESLDIDKYTFLNSNFKSQLHTLSDKEQEKAAKLLEKLEKLVCKEN